MATFNLSALPAHHEHEDGRSYRTTVIEILGSRFGTARVEAKSVAEVAAQVRAFGESVAAQHPDASFTIFISVAKGSRKPSGFDAAHGRKELGEEAWMKTMDKTKRQTASHAA